MHHKLLLFVFSIFLKHFVVSNFNIFAATLTQVKRFRITSSRRPHIGGRSCLVPISQCALPEKHFLPQHKLFFGGAGERLEHGRLRAAMHQPTPKKP